MLGVLHSAEWLSPLTRGGVEQGDWLVLRGRKKKKKKKAGRATVPQCLIRQCFYAATTWKLALLGAATLNC